LKGICHPILLGSKEIILELKEELGFTRLEIIDPKIKEDIRRNKFATIYWEQKRKGIFAYDAQN
jgi:malate dehydrogenase (oxaloacetate-decarboxylating)(NADP+)